MPASEVRHRAPTHDPQRADRPTNARGARSSSRDPAGNGDLLPGTAGRKRVPSAEVGPAGASSLSRRNGAAARSNRNAPPALGARLQLVPGGARSELVPDPGSHAGARAGPAFGGHADVRAVAWGIS